MVKKSRTVFLLAVITSFFFLAMPGVVAESFNVETDGLTDKGCSLSTPGESSVERFEFELEDEYDSDVYPTIELEIDAEGDWLGRGENFQAVDFKDAEIEPVPGEHNEFDLILEAEYVGDDAGEDQVEYCYGDLDATLELKDMDLFHASSEPRTFNIHLQSETWDGSNVHLDSTEIDDLEQTEQILKDYRSIFVEHEGRWIELPNLGGYEPDWGLPYDCDDECIQDELEDEEELLQYGWSEREILNLYWPPYEENTYNVISDYEQCRSAHEEVENIVIDEEGSLSTEDTGMRSYCPLTDSYVAETPDENVHEILRNLEDLDYDIEPDRDWMGERLPLSIDIRGNGGLIIESDGEEISESPVETTTSVNIEEGSSVTLTPDSDDGYAMSGWEDDCEDAGNTCQLEMTEEKTATVQFTGESIEMNIDQPESGDTLTFGEDDIVVEWDSINNFVDERQVEETEITIEGDGGTVSLDEDDMSELEGMSVDNSVSRNVEIDSSIYSEVTALEEDLYQPETWTVEVTDHWDEGDEVTETVDITVEPEPLPSNECMEQLATVENQIPQDRRGPELEPPRIGECGVEGADFEETVYRENIKNELQNMGWTFREEGDDQESLTSQIMSILWDAVKITAIVSIGWGLAETIYEDVTTDADEIDIDDGFDSDDFDMDDDEFEDMAENDDWEGIVDESDEFDSVDEAQEAGMENFLQDTFVDGAGDAAEWTYENIVKPVYIQGALSQVREEMFGIAPDDIDPGDIPAEPPGGGIGDDDDSTTEPDDYVWVKSQGECDKLSTDDYAGLEPDGENIFETESECEDALDPEDEPDYYPDDTDDDEAGTPTDINEYCDGERVWDVSGIGDSCFHHMGYHEGVNLPTVEEIQQDEELFCGLDNCAEYLRMHYDNHFGDKVFYFDAEDVDHQDDNPCETQRIEGTITEYEGEVHTTRKSCYQDLEASVPYPVLYGYEDEGYAVGVEKCEAWLFEDQENKDYVKGQLEEGDDYEVFDDIGECQNELGITIQ